MRVDKARLSFLTPVIALLLGIIIELYVPQLIAAAVLFTLAVLAAWITGFRKRATTIILIHVAILTAGWFSASLSNTPTNDHYSSYQYYNATEYQWLVSISSTPRYRDDLISFEAEVLSIDSTAATGSIKVYLNTPYNKPQLKFGEVLSLYGKPSEIKAPANPYEFDYKAYLARQGIQHQFYLYPGQWKNQGVLASDIYSIAYDVRSAASQQLMSALNDSVLSSIAISMILGDRTLLDQETRAAFAITGAAHILAISGLHVGLIFGLLVWLWQQAIGKNRYKWLRFVVILIILWGYALLTGLSPSVMRATVMFSFILAGMSLREKGYVLNSLAASAFLLLLVNPRLIHSAGFWLSYSAVAGIVLLYPKLYALVNLKSGFRHFLWQLLVVSFSAQLATLPITIYLFHQTPVMGLLTNLLVVPLATFILYSGLSYLALSWVPLASVLLAFVFKSLVSITVGIVNWMAAWPFVALTGIYISTTEFVLWVVLIASCIAFLYSKQARPLIVSLGCVLLLLTFSTYRQWQQTEQQHITVYSIHDKTIVDVFSGNTAISINNLNATTDAYNLSQKIQPNRDAHGIKTCYNLAGLSSWPVRSYITNSGRYYLIGDIRLAIISEVSKKNIPSKPLPLDYLILSDNPKTTMDFLSQVYNARHIIIDRSNSSKKVDKWMLECQGKYLPCYNAYEKAFSETLVP